jgi:protein-S-isoprenylcysteine O-methyltransferase Ste14
LASWYLWLASSAVPSMLYACAALVILGCALRSWAAGYLLKGKRVPVGGPYAYVRNPLYVGSFLIGAGFCLALYRTPLPRSVAGFWSVYLIGFIALYAAKSKAEEQELARALGQAYETYRERVPALLPLRGKLPGLGAQRFSGELYQRNREYQCIWGSVTLLAFIIWRRKHGI